MELLYCLNIDSSYQMIKRKYVHAFVDLFNVTIFAEMVCMSQPFIFMVLFQLDKV